jgi:hypothetical protein
MRTIHETSQFRRDLLTNKSHHTTGKNKTTDYPDEHGYEEMGTSAFAARMGQGKTKTLQAGLQDFCFFLPIPAHWDHPCPSEPSVVSCSPTAPSPWVAQKAQEATQRFRKVKRGCYGFGFREANGIQIPGPCSDRALAGLAGLSHRARLAAHIST